MGGQPLHETFSVDRGDLVRSVVPARGTPYQHRCSLASYEAVAHAAEEIGSDGITLERLAAEAGVPNTQAAVALAFLKDRGCVTRAHGRIHVPASGGLHLDAMIEYHALAVGG